jgi:hypothetical protein
LGTKKEISAACGLIPSEILHKHPADGEGFDAISPSDSRIGTSGTGGNQGGTESGTVDARIDRFAPDLVALVEAWPNLSAEVRLRLDVAPGGEGQLPAERRLFDQRW